MARRPLVPRLHLFEIDDQEWFPAWFRWRVQAALTIAWNISFPLLGGPSPTKHAAHILKANLGQSVKDYVFIDFCAGGGGPTPGIEREINKRKVPRAEAAVSSVSAKAAPAARHLPPVPPTSRKSKSKPLMQTPTYVDTDNEGTAAGLDEEISMDEPVEFVLTDLHPHVDNWAAAAAASPFIHYEPESVDASNAPPELLEKYSGGKHGKRIFRLFNLAFHHFDDPLAMAILKNTVETSDGFAIFELQDRSFSSFLMCSLFGIGIILLAPLYAWKWRSPMTLFFSWLVPILPFVLVFDGWVSSLRTRTPDEVEALLRMCGTEGGEDAIKRWELHSGRVQHFWPCGHLNWIVCVKH